MQFQFENLSMGYVFFLDNFDPIWEISKILCAQYFANISEGFRKNFSNES